MLSKLTFKKNQQHLKLLPKLVQSASGLRTLFSAKDYRHQLLTLIKQAKTRVYLVALYLEHDDAGQDILSALYQAKITKPELEIAILVDWHRAQRGRIGAKEQDTNADWYCAIAKQYAQVELPIYGIPINTREALGVLHLKGSVIDDQVIYTGASINDVYLHQHDQYRYDRYHLLTNALLADCLIQYIKQYLLNSDATHRLNNEDRPRNYDIKKQVRRFRAGLHHANYQVTTNANNEQLAVTPLVGLGKHSSLNKTLIHLISSTEKKLTICTPYFNLPPQLVKIITKLLRQGREVEIIIGDKTANDFYIPQDQPFKIIGALPYLYEINLRRFATRLQQYTDQGLLNIRLWQNQSNTFHLKGIWVDSEWLLITGNNLNPRAINLDLENGILIHDPNHELIKQHQQELNQIREHSSVITHFQQLQSHQFYPDRIRKLIRRLRQVRIDRLINRIL